MKKNVGKLDSYIRIATGLVLLSMLFWIEGNVRYTGLIGIVLIATAFIRYCPLYTVLGIRTITKKETESVR
ncbi:MAG: DUF2892 domain-containing protein [Ignavibacteria bacterium]